MFRMLTLYYRPSCPFCRRVLAVVDRMQLSVELKDISEANIQAELMNRGGKSQVPYLVDSEYEVEMYESDAIVDHLQSKYGKKTISSNRPRIHISDNACLSCEG